MPFDGESAGEILMKHLTSPPDLSRVPAEWVAVVNKALTKNPVHRYASMTEMARDVEAVGQKNKQPARSAPPPLPAEPVRRRAEEPILTALPAVSTRQQWMELSWSMAVTVAFAGLATALWVALRLDQYSNSDFTRLSTPFFLTIAASWAILIPAKFWTERRGDSWTRRLVMLGLGGAVGLLACWLDGWSLGRSYRYEDGADLFVKLFPHDVAVEATYFSYYALAFFVLRWWRMTNRRRTQRFSFAPILGAGFWGAVLLLMIRPPHQPWGMAALVLVMAATIVQLVSPYDPPPPAPNRRVRLRYA